jgi:hypothetical protein
MSEKKSDVYSGYDRPLNFTPGAFFSPGVLPSQGIRPRSCPFEGLKRRPESGAEVVLHDVSNDASALARACDAVVFFAIIHEGEGMDRSLLALLSRPVKAAKSTKNTQIIAAEKDLTIH